MVTIKMKPSVLFPQNVIYILESLREHLEDEYPGNENRAFRLDVTKELIAYLRDELDYSLDNSNLREVRRHFNTEYGDTFLTEYIVNILYNVTCSYKDELERIERELIKNLVNI